MKNSELRAAIKEAKAVIKLDRYDKSRELLEPYLLVSMVTSPLQKQLFAIKPLESGKWQRIL